MGSLMQLTNKPTRESNILDLVLTTDNELIVNLEVEDVFSTSDHKQITFDIKFSH